MVAQYGMSETFGPMSLESVQNRYLDGRNVKNCSEETATLIDDEVRRILLSCQQEAVSLLETNRASLDRIADYLLEKENINGDEFMRLLEDNAAAA